MLMKQYDLICEFWFRNQKEEMRKNTAAPTEPIAVPLPKHPYSLNSKGIVIGLVFGGLFANRFDAG